MTLGRLDDDDVIAVYRLYYQEVNNAILKTIRALCAMGDARGVQVTLC